MKTFENIQGKIFSDICVKIHELRQRLYLLKTQGVVTYVEKVWLIAIPHEPYTDVWGSLVLRFLGLVQVLKVLHNTLKLLLRCKGIIERLCGLRKPFLNGIQTAEG